MKRARNMPWWVLTVLCVGGLLVSALVVGALLTARSSPLVRVQGDAIVVTGGRVAIHDAKVSVSSSAGAVVLSADVAGLRSGESRSFALPAGAGATAQGASIDYKVGLFPCSSYYALNLNAVVGAVGAAGAAGGAQVGGAQAVGAPGERPVTSADESGMPR